jgi:membrane-bound lytic murein transglycosylase D
VHLSPKELKNYNPQLRYFFTPPFNKKYTIYIPYTKYSLFKSNFKPKKSNRKFYVYFVKKGDSLYLIGKRFGISYKVIKDFNHLKNNFLRLNKRLIIPSARPRYIKYIIRKGDTLSYISKRFKVKVKKIMEANNMKSSFLKPGVRIVIPN